MAETQRELSGINANAGKEIIYPDYTPIRPKYRILSVKASGDTGTKVRVVYYDTQNFEFHEKSDDWKHITVSREIVPQKHFYTPETLIAALKKIYPSYEFETRPYGSGDSRSEVYTDTDVYTQGTESFIVWHKGAREERNTLEFYLDEKKTKQIFFRNSPKRFLARTRLIDSSKVDACVHHFRQLPGLESILNEDILVKHQKHADKAYIQVKCTQKQLYMLPEAYFRILTYNSEYFSTEREAQELFEQIKFLGGYKTFIGQLKIVESFDEDRKKIFYVKATCDANKEFSQKLKSLKMHPREHTLENGRTIHVRSTLQELWDPLMLNNFASQLRDFFPIHTGYDPNIPLEKQANMLVNPFTIRSTGLHRNQNHLDGAVSDAVKFYLKNTCAIDLEVIDFNKGSQDISGRVYMAVLYSETENKLYMTKEFWQNEHFKECFDKKYLGKCRMVFADDEIDLIAKLSKDASRYYNIIGHNFKDFDHQHLIKYNYENKLFKQKKITKQIKDEIRQKRKIIGQERLWSHTTDQILDTYHYVKARADLFSDHKLSTFAGFSKSINYDEMHCLVKSRNLDALDLVVDYTLEDGDKTWALNKQILENAILESLATNKSLSSIFSSDPVKNFYDAGKRAYFMKLGTFRDRHSMSPRRHLEKLDNRMYNHEILLDIIKDMPQKFGEVKGDLYYPSIFIESFKDILFHNPVLHTIYIQMQNEKNLLVKADLLWKLSAALVVPVDKVKNYIEASGNVFGEYVDENKVYKSLSCDASNPDELMQAYYGSDDFELSRTSFIFRVEYAAKAGNSLKVGELPLDTTMIRYNNFFADRLKKFKDSGFCARSKKYFISEQPSSNGYSFGQIRALNLDDERMIGRMSDGSDKDIYQPKGKPKHPIVGSLVKDWLNGELDRESKVIEVASMPIKEQMNDINRQIIKAVLGFDPKRSKGNLRLF